MSESGLAGLEDNGDWGAFKVRNEESLISRKADIYITPIFSPFYQFVINKVITFTLLGENNLKKVGNQIHGVGLDFHVMKTQSTAVEIIEKAKTVLFWTKLGENCNKTRKCNPELKNQLTKREFYGVKWIFIA